jgi:membrane protease YdiL (CAAX protease family)
MARRTCPACSLPVKADKRFCSGCGYQLIGRSSDTARRAVQAIAIVFGGVFATLLVGLAALPDAPASNPALVLESSMITVGFLLCGLLAVVRLGSGAWDDSFGERCDVRALGLGLLVGLAGYAVNATYVAVMTSGLVGEADPIPEVIEFSPMFAVAFLTTVVLPSLNEEWADRGVLWVALRKITGPGATIFCTALLFAFMHGLNGVGLFEVPHRFVFGLGLGWLRQRTGSLWPCITAHALNNTLALLV